MIPEARADPRSARPALCGGRAHPKPATAWQLVVAANPRARCSILVSLPNSEFVPLGTRAAVVRVAHQLQIGRRRPMRSTLITAGAAWPTPMAPTDGSGGAGARDRVDVPPDRVCDRSSRRRATAADRASLARSAVRSLTYCRFRVARRWPAGAQRRLLKGSPAPAHFFGSRQDAPRLL